VTAIMMGVGDLARSKKFSAAQDAGVFSMMVSGAD